MWVELYFGLSIVNDGLKESSTEQSILFLNWVVVLLVELNQAWQESKKLMSFYSIQVQEVFSTQVAAAEEL